MPVTVDPSQVSSITVDPSQVQPAKAAALQTPQPTSSQPQGSAFSRVLAAVNPFPTLKHYLWDLPQQEQAQVGQQLHNGDYVGAIKTAAQSLPGVDLTTDLAKAQAHQAAQAYQTAVNNPDHLSPSDRIASASGHALAAALPVAGPIAADAGEKIGSGDVAGGAAEAATVLLPEAAKFIPGGAKLPLKVPSSLDPSEAAAVQFADKAGVPLDTATRTGSTVARYTQAILEHSLPSANIAKNAVRASEDALKTAGDNLASSVSAQPVTPELAGQGVQDALTAAAKAHDAEADQAYAALRTIEADPKNARVVETDNGAQTITSKTPAPSTETPKLNAVSSQAGGSQTSIPIPGSDTTYPAHYEARELATLQPSHDGVSFEANPDYPYSNDRDYTKGDARARVVQQGARLDTSRLLSDAAEATTGPPVIDSAGNVLGGNSRTMMLQRAAASADPAAAEAYKAALVGKTPTFGLDADAVKGMQRPVLVRVADGSFDPQTAITDFNKSETASLSPSEQAVADARTLTPGTTQFLGHALEKQGDGATLADVMNGPRGPEVLARLIDDGVISSQDRPKYLKDGLLTSAAKQRVGKMLAGTFFDNAADMDAAPASVVNKLERMAAPLAQLEGHTAEWDIRPKIQGAVKLLAEASQRGLPVDDLVGQRSMFDAPRDPETVQLAKLIQSTKGSDLAAGTRDFVAAAAPSHPNAPLPMFGTPARDESFAQAFTNPKANPAVADPAAPDKATPGVPAAAPSPAAKPAAAAPAAPTVRPVSLPVDMRMGKSILVKVNQEMTRLMPIAQQRASTGLVAIKNVLDGPDVLSASEADQNLSALKAAQREANSPQSARLLNMAVEQVSKAVDKAVAQAGPKAVLALKQGRAATTAKYAALDTLGKLREEPVQAFGQLFTRGDSNVNLLRDIEAKAPAAVKAAGRAYAEQLIAKAFAEGGANKPGAALSDWMKLGPETRRITFGPDIAKNFDSFFLLAKKLAENPNPSKTGYVMTLLQDGGLLLHPAIGAPVLLGKNLLARILFSPRGAQLLADGVRVPVRSTAAATLTVNRILQAAGIDQKAFEAAPRALQLPGTQQQPVAIAR